MMSFNGGGRGRRRGGPVAPATPANAHPRAQAPEAPQEDDTSFGWHASSLDLRLGCQVSERPMDTLPGELLDSFFRR